MVCTVLLLAIHAIIPFTVSFLYKKLHCTTVPSRWKELGVLLNIEKGILDSTGALRQLNPYHCLMDILDMWLKRVEPPPCLDDLIKALQFLQEEKVAHELKEQLKGVKILYVSCFSMHIHNACPPYLHLMIDCSSIYSLSCMCWGYIIVAIIAFHLWFY